MKNKKFIFFLCYALLLCGCTENNTNVTSENAAVSSERETAAAVMEQASIPTETAAQETDPAAAHRPSGRDEITCDFVQIIKEENEIYADDGTLLAPVTVEYPQVLTYNKQVNEKINNAYIEFKDSVLQGNTPFFNTEELSERYDKYNTTWNGIDCDSELQYYDEKYISFYDYHLEMAHNAAHPIHAYTTHTFSLETGELLTIDDIFNEKFIHFAEKYISDDIEAIDQKAGFPYFGKIRHKISGKLENNEWYFTPDGFSVNFAHEELTGYAFGTIVSTIPWKLIEEYEKTIPSNQSAECDFVKIISEDSEITADDGTILFQAHADYPQISTDNQQVNNAINEFFIEKKNGILTTDADSKKYFYDNRPDGMIWHPDERTMETGLKYANEDYISFYTLKSSYGTGAAHSLYGMEGSVFSLHTGKKMNIDDIFENNFKDFAKGYIISELNQRSNDETIWEDYQETVTDKIDNPDTQNWYLDEKGFILVFEPYDISCFGDGFKEVEIPWEQIEQYIKPD